MLRTSAFICLMLAACTPQKPPETPEVAIVDPADAAKYKPAPAGEITVKAPLANARVTSPLVAEGEAINNWFFEGQFVAELVSGGKVLVHSPAMQAGDRSWTDPGQVQFRAVLEFMVSKETHAELILSEDMPELVSDDGDERGPARSVRIPVVLLPGK